MTEEYLKGLIGLAERIDNAQDTDKRNQWIQHLIGYILALKFDGGRG